MKNTAAREVVYASLVEGEQASFSHLITEADVDIFASLSGDHNPLHTDDTYAATTQFGKRVVHGMLLGSLVSRLVGMHLPGRYALLVKETLEFKKPVLIGDTVMVTGTLTRKSDATKLIDIQVVIAVGDTVVTRGEVMVRMLA